MDKVRYLDAHRDETSRDEIELTDGRTFDRYSAPMHALDGVYYGRVWYFRDVTGVKAAEAALRRQRDLAQRYLDVAQVLLLALDVQGRITLVNRKGCSILEWEEHDLLGRDWFETCLPESVRADMRARFADLLDDALTTHENPVLTRSGRQRLIAWRNTLVRDDAGRVIGTLSSGEDITHRKQLETQLRQSQKMEAIGSLAGGVAHDFNNLLTAILGYAAFVAETLDPADPRRQDMDEITRAADRATGLTRQLLAFSRKQVLRPARLDVNGLISTMSRMLRRLIGEDIELVTNLAADLAPVLADAGQIEQILLNLAVNARDAMPHGGRLLIETANVVLDEAGARPYAPARSGPYVMFTVADTGVGMDERTKRRLFEPFFTTKEPGRGTGLGLATVHGIVEQSGGFISLDSQPGHGARFSVYLPPTAETAIADEPNVASDAVLTGSESILVVEDEQAVRSLARVILAKAGYQVFDAPDPASAAEVFSRHADSIDLVLTDVIMPGSTGPSLFSRLAADRPHLKVLYMSGYANEAVLQRAGITSGIDFLQKPFSSDALLRKVRDALGKRQK
jgi:PAS domain S-box-containing protein